MVSPSQIISIVLSVIMLIFLLPIIIRLIKKVIETKLSNLMLLLSFFIGRSFVGPIKMVVEYVPPLDLVFYAIEIINLLSLVFFIKGTFYKNRQSAYVIILIIVVCLMVGSIITGTFRLINYHPAARILELYFLTQATIAASIWFASASFTSYYALKKEDIDENIKLRYKILGISAIIKDSIENE